MDDCRSSTHSLTGPAFPGDDRRARVRACWVFVFFATAVRFAVVFRLVVGMLRLKPVICGSGNLAAPTTKTRGCRCTDIPALPPPPHPTVYYSFVLPAPSGVRSRNAAPR